MKKFKKAQAGMTIVEVIVAMAIFAVMFLMIFGFMESSIYLNRQTRKYDQEVDVQVEDVERYNPMGAYIDGISSGSTEVSEYEGSTGSGKKTLSFQFPTVGKVITIDGYAYQANSRDDENGFSLKFFSSTRPDVTNKKVWIRIINVTDDVKDIFLYLPTEDGGKFYLKNGTSAYTDKISKSVPKDTALSVGFDYSTSGTDYFWATLDGSTNYSSLTTVGESANQIDVRSANLSSYMDSDGYIDIYLTPEGFKSKTDYIDYINMP